jgi:Caspase domain
MNAEQFAGHVWVILVGVNTNKEKTLPPLLSPGNDVRMLTTALANKDGCAIPKEQIFTLINEEATTPACLDLLQHVLPLMNREDVLIFYFSGHGESDENGFYLCTSNSILHDLPNTALSGDQLNILLLTSIARGVLVVLDCCKSAAFADLSPSFFRKLGDKDFKILLSAARANEPSWERADGKGTLFSMYLKEIISGDRQPGSTPGLVYFSELLNDIQNQLKEDYESSAKNLPVQEPVFAGSYVLDPLIFVHKRLTLRQVAVKTKRYSREYVRRIIKKTVIGIVLVFFITCGLYYATMDNLEFVLFENDHAVSYKGYPGLQFLGFPKKLWEYDFGRSDLQNNSLLFKDEPITSQLGEPVFPLLINQLTLFRQAEVSVANGEINKARYLLRKALMNSSLNQPDKWDGLGLLNRIKNPADSDILSVYTSDPDVLTRTEAIRGLFRINSKKGSELAQTDFSLHAEGIMVAPALENGIAASLTGCDENVSDYLGFLLKLPFNYTRKLALETSLRLNCQPPPGIIQYVFLHPAGDDWEDDLSNYVMMQAPPRQELILDSLFASLPAVNSITTKKLILELFEKTNSSRISTQAWKKYLIDNALVIQSIALRVLLKKGENIFEGLSPAGVENLKTNPQCTGWLLKAGLLEWNQAFDKLKKSNNLDQTDILQSLEDAGIKNSTATGDCLCNLLRNKNTYFEVKIKCIQILNKTGYNENPAKEFFSDNNLGVEAAAFEWYKIKHPAEVKKILFQKINDSRFYFAFDILSGMPLSREEIAFLRHTIHFSFTVPGAFIKLLAITGDEKDLNYLLLNKNSSIRNTASQYVTANPNFLMGTGHLIKSKNVFNTAADYLEEQRQLYFQISKRINDCPPNFRRWQLEKIKNTLLSNDERDKASPGLLLALGKLCQASL